MQISAEFAESRGLVLEVVADEEAEFLWWEDANGNVLEGIVFTEEDLIVRPVIGCSCGN